MKNHSSNFTHQKNIECNNTENESFHCKNFKTEHYQNYHCNIYIFLHHIIKWAVVVIR